MLYTVWGGECMKHLAFQESCTPMHGVTLYFFCLAPPGGFFRLSGCTDLGRGVFGVRRPPRTPGYVLHYSSVTPHLFASQSVIFCQQQVLISSFLKPEVLEKIQGNRHSFLCFAPIKREVKSLHICRRIPLKFGRVQDLGYDFGYQVYRRTSSAPLIVRAVQSRQGYAFGP